MPRALPSQNLAAREFGHAEGTRLERLSEGIIEAGWLVMLALVPLFMNPYSARTFEPDKTALVRSIAVVMVAAWIWKVLIGGRAWVPAGGSKQVATADTGRDWWEIVGASLRIPLVIPVLVLVLSLVLGSVLSVDSRLSWYGSYPRFQGAWTQLSYIAVFGLVLAHLRDGMQWRRISFAVIMTSFLVALYALLQTLGLDPLPSAIGRSRAFSTLGNPIFLAAYLLMAFFVTVFELLRFWSESRAPSGIEDGLQRNRVRRRLGLAVLLGILILQILAVVLSQSRGPFLGLLAGGYVFALLLALMLHGWARTEHGLSTRLSRLLRWAWLGIIGLGFLGLVFLILFTMPGSPLEPLHDIPYLGRLGTVLNFESNTAQVRLLIWEGVVELLGSDEPLRAPDGSVDRLQALREWIGYGPEAFSVAFNPYYPPELGQRSGRGDAPDRAHNETFDALVMQGGIGYAAWLAVYCGIFYLCLRRLGLIRNRWQKISFWLNLSLGALLGAVGSYQLTGTWVLSGVALPAGMILGLMVYVTLEAVLSRPGRGELRRFETQDGLLMAVLATVVAHVVEIHFGIAIVSTRLYFWFLAALAVCITCGWMSLQREPVSDTESSGVEEVSKKSGKKKRQQRAEPREVRSSDADGYRWALFAGLILGLLGATLGFGLSLNPGQASRVSDVLIDGLYAKAEGGAAWVPGALLWLIASLSVGICLAWVWRPGSEVSGRPFPVRALAVGLGLGGLYLLLQAGRAAQVIRLQRETRELSEALSSLVNHVMVFFAFALLFLAAIALSLAFNRRDWQRPTRAPSAWPVLVALLLVGGSGWLIARANIDPLRSDAYLKQARTFIEAGRPELALNALSLATDLGPNEPMNFLTQGRAALAAGKQAGTDLERQRHLELAEGALSEARRLAPLDPDHSANLARYFVTTADLSEDPARVQESRELALGEYEAALALRPSSVLLINEYALLFLRMGELDRAEAQLERALALDPMYATTLARLGTVHKQRAADAQQAADTAAMIQELEVAVAFYERALLAEPDLLGASEALQQLRPVLFRYQRTTPSPARLRTLYGEDWRTHQSLARMHRQQGRKDLAAAHQSLADELAPGTSGS